MYFDTAQRLIERYGGTVEKFIGDAVMAVWGTPVANEDDAERDRCLAREHAGAGLERGIEGGDRGDEVERGPDGALRVVLVRDRRAPDGHHGVADELLDGAAVPADHVA